MLVKEETWYARYSSHYEKREIYLWVNATDVL